MRDKGTIKLGCDNGSILEKNKSGDKAVTEIWLHFWMMNERDCCWFSRNSVGEVPLYIFLTSVSMLTNLPWVWI
jgi:hypothetical protein